MKKQQRIQLFLFFAGVILIVLTYFYYPNTQKEEHIDENLVQKNIDKDLTDEQSNTFENVKYKGLYDFDKSFTVEAEKAYILSEESDVVYMSNMHVVLYLSDGRVVNILSDKGKYNKATYDCFFEENVRATEGETIISANNLDLLATKNSVAIYNNVSLVYSAGSLRADKIDYDFENKNFKVSMFNEDVIRMKVVQ